MQFKEITIQGAPYARGLSYGQQCREEIGVSIQVYGELFQNLKGISWENARKLSEFYLSHDANPRGSTYIRLQRIKALVKEAHGKITKEAVMEMLRDHAGHPYALCTHENPIDPVTSQYVTNFAIIMDLTEGCFYLSPGNPCESEFKRYDI